MPCATVRTRATKAPTLTVREAAYVTGAPEQRIQRAIDRDRLTAKVGRRGGHTMREIPVRSVLSFAIEQRVSPYFVLRSEARKAVCEALDAVPVEVVAASDASLTSALRSVLAAKPSVFTVEVGPATLFLGTMVGEILIEIQAVLESRAEVIVDPDIRAGEPVVRGTRVPVHRLADLKAQGVSDAVLLEDYPSVRPDRLAAVLLFARLNPRRGRPARPAPWHAATPKVLLPATKGPRLERATSR